MSLLLYILFRSGEIFFRKFIFFLKFASYAVFVLGVIFFCMACAQEMEDWYGERLTLTTVMKITVKYVSFEVGKAYFNSGRSMMYDLATKTAELCSSIVGHD